MSEGGIAAAVKYSEVHGPKSQPRAIATAMATAMATATATATAKTRAKKKAAAGAATGLLVDFRGTSTQQPGNAPSLPHHVAVSRCNTQ